jgi:predicted transcriptional regulator
MQPAFSTIAEMRAADIMTRKLFSLPPDMDVFQALGVLAKHRISGAPVVNAERQFLGIFSEKCCMQVLIDAAYDQLPICRVDAYMDRTPLTIGEDADLLTICQIFLNTPRRRLPVLRNGEVVGQVSRRDVLLAAAKLIEAHPNHEAKLLYLSALRSSNEVLIT